MFALTFVAGLLFVASASLSFEEDHHTGPRMAIAFATDDLSEQNGRLALSNRGVFSELARSNPNLWLIVRNGAKSYSVGNPPRAAFAASERLQGLAQFSDFHVPALARPLSDASAETVMVGPRQLFIAAGGIDSRQIRLTHAIRYFLNQGLFLAFLGLGLIGLFVAMISLPLLTSALASIGREAGSLSVGDESSRLDVTNVPRELVPLVTGFNQLLDRLEVEQERRRQLIADVAHEIRTPLAILQLQAERIADETDKLAIERTLSRVTNLLGQVLDVERMSASGGDFEPLDLVTVAREVVTEMAPLAIASGYEISFEGDDSRDRVHGDRTAIERAIANLIGNAILHGGGAGKIVIRSTSRQVDVVDDGPGIPEKARASVFEPFVRAGESSGGSGLGLHLTKAIMRAHGGVALLVPSQSGAHLRLQFPSVDVQR